MTVDCYSVRYWLLISSLVVTTLSAAVWDNATTLPNQDPTAAIRDVSKILELQSDFKMRGHPVALSDALFFLDSPFVEDSWKLRTTIDSKALERAGINLKVIVISEFHATGISRKTALRLWLARATLGYAVDRDGLIVTTKLNADLHYAANSEPPSVENLAHSDADVRRETAFAAGSWHVDAQLWIVPLIAGLSDSDREVRFNAAYALAAFGPAAHEAIDELSAMLISDDLTVREVASYSLSQLGPDAVQGLLAALDNTDQDIAGYAGRAIGDMGVTAKEFAPDLITLGKLHVAVDPLVHEVDYCERCTTIASVIAKVDVGGDLESLRTLLNSDIAGERALAANAIGEFGSYAQICEVEMQELLSDHAVTVRRKAAWALAQMELPSNTETAALEAASSDSDRTVALWAAKALRIIRSK